MRYFCLSVTWLRCSLTYFPNGLISDFWDENCRETTHAWGTWAGSQECQGNSPSRALWGWVPCWLLCESSLMKHHLVLLYLQYKRCPSQLLSLSLEVFQPGRRRKHPQMWAGHSTRMNGPSWCSKISTFPSPWLGWGSWALPEVSWLSCDCRTNARENESHSIWGMWVLLLPSIRKSLSFILTGLLGSGMLRKNLFGVWCHKYTETIINTF